MISTFFIHWNILTGCMNLLYHYPCFGLLFKYTYVLAIFATSRKKDSRPKWAIYKHESDKNKKCLSVSNFGILSVVVICSTPTACASLCRFLEYLLKLTFFIQNHPSVAKFLIFKTVLLGRSTTLSYVWKNITKMIGICVWKHLSSTNFHRMFFCIYILECHIWMCFLCSKHSQIILKNFKLTEKCQTLSKILKIAQICYHAHNFPISITN